MSKTHNYKNPSQKQDLSHVEAGGDDEGFGFAGAKTIMINSGLINGIPVHADYNILTNLLRKKIVLQKSILVMMQQF